MLVCRLGYRRSTDIDIGCVTYQRFTIRRGNGYRVPLACRTSAQRGLELEKEHEILRAKRMYGCLFVRKLAPSCDLSCFVKSGFESFQCGGAPAKIMLSG